MYYSFLYIYILILILSRGDKKTAKELSLKGQNYNKLMLDAHSIAAVELFIQHNSKENINKGWCRRSVCLSTCLALRCTVCIDLCSW